MRKDNFEIKGVAVGVYPDRQSMGEAAAEAAAALLSEAVEASGRARIIVGTGASQTEFIAALVQKPGLRWDAVEVFHMDEYAGMPETHPASFRRWLKERLTDLVHPGAVRLLRGDAPDPDAECARYADLLGSVPVDITFAGFGENGHIAFNDPHVADFHDPLLVKRVAMDERCRMQQVNDGAFPSLADVPLEALSITCTAIARSRNIIACVPGIRKAQAVRDAVEGPLTTACPASLVFTHPSARVFLDRESASLLSTLA